jgi:hypothetical protein
MPLLPSTGHLHEVSIVRQHWGLVTDRLNAQHSSDDTSNLIAAGQKTAGHIAGKECEGPALG